MPGSSNPTTPPPNFAFNGMTKEFTREVLRYNAQKPERFASVYDAADDYLRERSRQLFTDPVNESPPWVDFFRDDETAAEFAAKLETLGFLREHADRYATSLFKDLDSSYYRAHQSRGYWAACFFRLLQPTRCNRKGSPVPFE